MKGDHEPQEEKVQDGPAAGETQPPQRVAGQAGESHDSRDGRERHDEGVEEIRPEPAHGPRLEEVGEVQAPGRGEGIEEDLP